MAAGDTFLTCSPSRTYVALTARIIEVQAMSKGTYGAPRIHSELADTGHGTAADEWPG